jgi:fluoroquinolone transport system ATP-binding protein
MIHVESLRFTYAGASRPALDGVDFDVAQGEVYGLLGPSGAGKSTTQRILMGLLQGYTGTAELFGQPVAAMGRGIYERIGVSFELPAVYQRLTAVENLRLFAALYAGPTRDPVDVLAEVDLTDAAGQRVDTFSKGMKMRLNLARALLHDPDMLFLDEPTTGQDPARSRLTRNLIRRLKTEGKTIFLTTHNMSEAEEVCDRVGFLFDGTIPVTGTPAELKRRFGQRRLEVTAAATDGTTVHRFPMEDIGRNAEFLALLASDRVVALHTMEASLDDIFIKATGHEVP